MCPGLAALGILYHREKNVQSNVVKAQVGKQLVLRRFETTQKLPEILF